MVGSFAGRQQSGLLGRPQRAVALWTPLAAVKSHWRPLAAIGTVGACTWWLLRVAVVIVLDVFVVSVVPREGENSPLIRFCNRTRIPRVCKKKLRSGHLP